MGILLAQADGPPNGVARRQPDVHAAADPPARGPTRRLEEPQAGRRERALAGSARRPSPRPRAGGHDPEIQPPRAHRRRARIAHAAARAPEPERPRRHRLAGPPARERGLAAPSTSVTRTADATSPGSWRAAGHQRRHDLVNRDRGQRDHRERDARELPVADGDDPASSASQVVASRSHPGDQPADAGSERRPPLRRRQPLVGGTASPSTARGPRPRPGSRAPRRAGRWRRRRDRHAPGCEDALGPSSRCAGGQRRPDRRHQQPGRQDDPATGTSQPDEQHGRRRHDHGRSRTAAAPAARRPQDRRRRPTGGPAGHPTAAPRAPPAPAGRGERRPSPAAPRGPGTLRRGRRALRVAQHAAGDPERPDRRHGNHQGQDRRLLGGLRDQPRGRRGEPDRAAPPLPPRPAPRAAGARTDRASHAQDGQQRAHPAPYRPGGGRGTPAAARTDLHPLHSSATSTDPVRARDRARPVGDQHHHGPGPAAPRTARITRASAPHPTRRRLVQQEDRRSPDERAGDAHPTPLPAGQPDGPARRAPARPRCHPARPPPARHDDRGIGRRRRPQPDVVGDGAREQQRRLRDPGDPGAPRLHDPACRWQSTRPRRRRSARRDPSSVDQRPG